MEVAKVHAFIGLLVVGFFAFRLIIEPKELGHEQLAVGRETTEERANLSKIKPLKPIAYINRNIHGED